MSAITKEARGAKRAMTTDEMRGAMVERLSFEFSVPICVDGIIEAVTHNLRWSLAREDHAAVDAYEALIPRLQQLHSVLSAGKNGKKAPLQHGDSTVFVRDGETVGAVLGPREEGS